MEIFHGDTAIFLLDLNKDIQNKDIMRMYRVPASGGQTWLENPLQMGDFRRRVAERSKYLDVVAIVDSIFI